jgi:hypothetical protein
MSPLVLAACVLACVAAPAGAGDPAAELRTLTEQRFEANARNDRAFYERLLAPNCVVLLPGLAPQARGEYLQGEFGSRPAGYRGAKATLSDLVVRAEGDTAVVTYTAVEPTALGEQAFESRSRRLDSSW